jgi:hypothetical protein
LAPELGAAGLQGQRKRSARSSESLTSTITLAADLEPFEGGRRGLGAPELVFAACVLVSRLFRKMDLPERAQVIEIREGPGGGTRWVRTSS